MLYRASVTDLKNKRVTRRSGHLAVTMQYYPRFLSKTLIHEYVRSLAPDRELFTEFKERERQLEDHDRAFDEVHYENRFSLSQEGREDLDRLSRLSQDQNVFLVCQCESLQKCHVDLLLMAAKKLFHAKTQLVRREYPIWAERLEKEN